MKYLLSLALVCAASLHAATQITWKRQQLHGDFYSEGAGIGDINGDGKPDVVAGPFWWEGPAFEKKHAYYEPKIFSINGYSDNFFAYVHDFNGDKKNDILILGFPGKEARLYLNPGVHDDKPWPMSIVADVVDNESPVFTDITGDGKPEIVCSTGGRFGWFAPNWEKPTEKWTFVAISDDMKVARFTHGLGVGDVNGDGKLDLMEARRWWEQPTGNREPRTGNWQQHNFAAGVGGGAQMFAYDFDGNGTQDVFTALAAHRYGVAVYLQNKPAPNQPTWKQVMLASENPAANDYGIVFSQPHAAHLTDINGDGVQDVVVGKRYWAHNGHDPDERGARVIYWYETKRDGKGGVDFVPHLVDANSGVGVDVQVGDVNGDKLPDIVVGNKAGVFILTQQRKEIGDAEAQIMEPKKMYGPALKPQAEYAHGQSPQDTLKAIQLPGGFKAELIAAEPDIVQPIAMCWDERGRLWVVEGMSYPQPREPGAGKDRIKILEDKDGDGTFETIKVFAEGISLASGIEVGFGGVWVGAAPYLMFIPDRDKDDKPDAPEIGLFGKEIPKVPGLSFTAYALLDGWGSQDTHETLNSFIWGPDGWLYGCHGVFTHSKVGKPGTPDDQRTPINAGVWRYHPVRHVFEVFAHGTSNPWGLDYDQNGEFFVTACVIPHLFHIVPGARYQRQAGPHFNPYTYEDIKTIADHAHYSGNLRPDVTFDKTTGAGVVNNDTNSLGGGHAHCGLAIYQSSLFPPMYRNALMFGNLHGHRIVSDYLEPHGSTYTGKHGSDFMRSNDMNFIPVTQKVGPDGALYVSDWNDKQVCHRGSGAVELWDRSNGRIYRVTYGAAVGVKALADQEAPAVRTVTGSPKGLTPTIPVAPFDLSKESDVSLAKLAVQTENDWFSRMARRVLMERARKKDFRGYTPICDTLKFNPETGVPLEANPQKRLKAMWALHIGDPSVRWSIEKSPHESSRVWAIRYLAQSFDPSFLPQLLGVAQTEASPLIRRELASLLQHTPLTQRPTLATALLTHGEDKDDPMIPLLIWYGIEPVVGADAKLGLELAKASKMPKVTEFIYRRLADTPEGRVALLRVLAGETAPKAAAGGGEAGDGAGETPKGGAPVQKGGSDTRKGGGETPKGGAPIQKGGSGAEKGGSTLEKGSHTFVKGSHTFVKGSPTFEKGSHTFAKGSHTFAKGSPTFEKGSHTFVKGSHTFVKCSHTFVKGSHTFAKGSHTFVKGSHTFVKGSHTLVKGSPTILKVGGAGTVPAPPARFSPEERERILGAIVAAARGSGRQVMPPDWPDIASALRRAASPRALGLIDELGALFGDTTSLAAFRATLADPQASPAQRENALVILTQTRDAGTAALLIQLIKTGDKALTHRAVQALGTLAHAETAALLIEKFASFDATTKQDAVNTLATSTTGAKALLTAVKAKTIATTLLSPFLARQIATLKNPEVDALLKETFGDLNAPKADLAQRKQKFRPNLTPAVLAKADAAKGRFVFNAVCGQCHKLFGEGQNVGPDLTGSNRANLDYMLDNVLDPNAVIGKDYQLNIFELKDGRVASGVVKEESAAAYRIALPGGIEQTITTAEVRKRTVAKVSTMPEGLFDTLPTEQLQQLVAYLQTNAAPAKADNTKGRAAIKVEGAIEGETLKVIEVKGGNTKLQGMAGFGGKWSNGQQLWWTGAKPGSTLTLALPVAEKGKYQLKGVLTKARDYGIVSVALDGKEVLANFDGYNMPAVVLSDELNWGTHDFEAGEHKLTFTITGTNPQAVKSYMIGLDYVKLEKK